MWCERVIRNCAGQSEADWGGRTVEWVDIEWNECGRLLKKQTRSGQPVRVLLPPGQKISHNDVIFESATHAIAIHVMPCEVVVAGVSNAVKMAALALELGNLHLPVEIRPGQLLFIEDGPAMEVLDALQIQFTREVRRFEPMKVISSPSVEVSPTLRTIIRSKNAGEQNEGDQVLAGGKPRNSASNV
jgi:urease accessory protein UreE